MKKRINSHILFCYLFILACTSACKKDNGSAHNASVPMVISNFTPVQGGGGTEVLISGINYTNDTTQISVTLNGRPLKVVGVNGSQIMAVVPKKIGSGHIVVKIGNDSVVSTGIFNYIYTRT